MSWKDKFHIDELTEFEINKALSKIENEDVKGLKEVINSLKEVNKSGLHDKLKNAFTLRHHLYRLEHKNSSKISKSRVHSLAKKNLGLIIPESGCIIRFFFFQKLYQIAEFVYIINIEGYLDDQDIKNVYLSRLDERLIYGLDKFDVISEWPQPNPEYFQKLKKIKWENKNIEKFSKKLRHLKSAIVYPGFSISKYHHLSATEEAFIELISACNAVNHNKDYINKENIITGYKTYLKLLNTDLTKYKTKNTPYGKKHVGEGYLVCDKCHEYYKLQQGESPDEFTDKCECGGKLKYYDKIN